MLTPAELAQRYIPFSSLRYSTDAFIDYCLPECQPKYNYALIGPGVSQNPNQPINLREHHGFQVGAVSIPHGKINPPHMHFTCEVFMCVRGNWRVQWGFNPEPSAAEIGEGDIVSMPTWMYRGFTNTGVDDGFLFTVLGGDSTGGILWGPSTLAAARAQGVQLTDDYQIVDARRGDKLPAGARLLQPMSEAEIAALRVWSAEEMAQRTVRFANLRWSQLGLLDSALAGCGGQLAAVIGLGVVQDRNLQAPVANGHGVSVEWLRLPAGGSVSTHRLKEKQVLIAKAGQIDIRTQTTEGPVTHTTVGAEHAWDSFSIPPDHWRSLHNSGPGEALALLLTAGDHRKHVEWDPSVVQAAAAQDWALDANGFVGAKHLVDRAQR
jgi:quercetin dioxygenase-like cupin family protein